MSDWLDSKIFWRDKRVIVTGGGGFLGSFVVEKLQERGAAEIIVPRRSEYDPSTLRQAQDMPCSGQACATSSPFASSWRTRHCWRSAVSGRRSM